MPRRKKSEENTEALETKQNEPELEENLEPEPDEAPAEMEATQEFKKPEEEAPAEEEAAEAVEEEVKKPRRRRARKPKVAAEASEELPGSDEISVASVTMQKSMESVAKQWVLMREISGHITTQFERVNQILQELPKEAFQAPPPKPHPLSKIAVGAAGLAFVFSVISLSMSQSVRSFVLSSRDYAPKTVAIAPPTQVVVPRQDDSLAMRPEPRPEPRMEARPVERARAKSSANELSRGGKKKFRY